jgi:hypothetical protein
VIASLRFCVGCEQMWSGLAPKRTRGYVLGANTIGAPGLGGIVLAVRSGSGTLNLQTSPVEAKVGSTFPPNWSSARKKSRVPKP